MRLAHHHRAPAGPEARRGRQRGAALVEMAFVAMILVILSAGAFDYGMAWRVGLATNEAARTAARTGSGMGTDPLTDWYALSGARSALAASGRLQDVQRVVIYKSTSTDGQVPVNCTTGAATTELCVEITGAQFRNMSSTSFNSTTGCFVGAVVANWCPSSRNDVQQTADYYGVWIQTRYTNQFKMISQGTTVNRDAVMRIEPAD
ncbi:MAG: TadE/TadG family type IV pilus assembly protein [Acidimicrobiales bacterium]